MTSKPDFDRNIFRYRSINSLLGERAELKNQSIYFAPAESLNDPMEGLRRVVWRGDRVTWRNLLRNYVICLENRITQALLHRDNETLDPNAISVFQTLDNVPTPQMRDFLKQCIQSVEQTELHATLLDFLAGAERDISFTELKQHLRFVHFHWLQIIQKAMSDQGFMEARNSLEFDEAGMAANLRAMQDLLPKLAEDHGEAVLEAVFEVQERASAGIGLHTAFNNAETASHKKQSLIFDFPSEYLRCLLKLVYPSWYVACFSERHDNVAMWSYYANEHNGCCLIFRKLGDPDQQTLRLNGARGFQASRGEQSRVFRERQDLALRSVNYTSEHPQLEFFSNLGRISQKDAMDSWFTDDDGKVSALSSHLTDPTATEKWRGEHWDRFLPPLLSKHPDWRHEEERRVVLHDNLGIHDKPEDRTFTYDFDTLEGIIFGMNVKMSDQVKALQIIEPKLVNRSSDRPFKLYQARYNSRTGKMECFELHLITGASTLPSC
ncbi:DUF2971 domain-containing protein [Celeribacter sp. ULVN23_4]